MTDQLPGGRPADRVPVRTILATIGFVLATVALLWVVVEVRRVLTWLLVAAFFAVALTPLVEERAERGEGR